jgi:hypothetical protein
MIQMEDGLSSPKLSAVRTKVNPCDDKNAEVTIDSHVLRYQPGHVAS